MAIKSVKFGIASVKPVSALSIAKKASTLWAYAEQPIELLALKILDAAKATVKEAAALGKLPEKFTYAFSEGDAPYIEKAIERFTALKSGFNFGLDYDDAASVATFHFPHGKLSEEKKTVKK